MSITDYDNTRYVLWTGGFDSTFMLLQFARQELSIQPIYVIDPGRKSTQYEMCAMDLIINLLVTKYKDEIRARIMPLEIIRLQDIPADEYLTKCYQSLAQKGKLGTQYEWLSRLASLYPCLDIGVEKHIDGFGGCSSLIKQDGGFVDINGIGQLNTADSSEMTIALFGRFRFPIYQITGTEMLAMIRTWGWDEIVENVWFCHNPVNGKPCGMCRPCQQKMEDNLQQLLPISARRRYKVYSLIRGIAGERFAERVVNAYRSVR